MRTEGLLLLFHLLQTPGHLDGVVLGGGEEVRIAGFAWDQDSDVAQTELFPVVLVRERRVSGGQDTLFARGHVSGGEHGCAGEIRGEGGPDGEDVGGVREAAERGNEGIERGEEDERK